MYFHTPTIYIVLQAGIFFFFFWSLRDTLQTAKADNKKKIPFVPILTYPHLC